MKHDLLDLENHEKSVYPDLYTEAVYDGDVLCGYTVMNHVKFGTSFWTQYIINTPEIVEYYDTLYDEYNEHSVRQNDKVLFPFEINYFGTKNGNDVFGWCHDNNFGPNNGYFCRNNSIQEIITIWRNVYPK